MLGFAIDRKIEREGKLRSVALSAGNVRISINQDDGAKGWDRIKGLGLSLNITTDQNIDTIANRIKKLGGTLESRACRHAMGSALIPVERPGRIQVDDLVAAPGVIPRSPDTSLRSSASPTSPPY